MDFSTMASSPSCGAVVGSGLMQRQIEAIRQMLNFNNHVVPVNVMEPSWKVLVYDAVGQAILTPLLSLKELRDLGVTLHVFLHSERDPITDVPAIYFCQPTDENLQRIGKDLELGLYSSFHLNFISSGVSRHKLEDLAAKAIRSNAVSLVEKVYDQYVDFICLEDDMFTLRKSGIGYKALNRPDVTDCEMDDVLNQMVDGLFAVCVTLATVPIIRCPNGNNAAEAVAKKLDKMLREHLKDARNSLFTPNAFHCLQRPLLIVLDRQVDLATTLHHTWTYQALAHDVLQYNLNRLTMAAASEPDGGTKAGKSKTFDLGNKDQFWVINRGSPFPLVAERIQEELEDYRLREDDIKHMKNDVEGNDNAAANLLSDNTQRLSSAVSSLPVLLEKKRLIDMHTSIATSMLDQIKLRKLDLFFELEEKIMSSRQQQQQQQSMSLMHVFQDPDAGTPQDKMRLFLIHFLCSSNVTEPEVEQYCQTLEEECGCDLSAFRYLKRWKSLATQTMTHTTSGAEHGTTTKTIGMFSKLMAQSSQFVMEGVKNLVVKRHNLPVTRIVEELMEMKPGRYQDEYKYFDPKLLRGGQEQHNIPRATNPFREAIVFMVGGGNYIEYQNLMDYVARKNPAQLQSNASYNYGGGVGHQQPQQRIIYGCSTLNNANQFMQQLAELGHDL